MEMQRLDKFIGHEAPGLSVGLMQKYFRQKDIKVNGKHAPKDTILNEGDVVQLYIGDEFFVKPKIEDPFLSKIKPKLDILYEDTNLMLVDKRPGLMCHPDANEKVNTLITHIQAYLFSKGEYNPDDEQSFAPALCASLQVSMCVKLLTGKPVETGTVYYFDLLNQEYETIPLV